IANNVLNHNRLLTISRLVKFAIDTIFCKKPDRPGQNCEKQSRASEFGGARRSSRASLGQGRAATTAGRAGSTNQRSGPLRKSLKRQRRKSICATLKNP